MPDGHGKQRKASSSRPSVGREQTKLEEQEIQPSTLPLGQKDAYLSYLRELASPHVDSFNFALGDGLHMMCEEIEPLLERGPAGPNGESSHIAIRFEELSVQKPRYNISSTASGIFRNLLPMQCRLTASNYLGDIYGGLSVSVNNTETFKIPVQRLGRIPIMVGSQTCHLHGLSREQLVTQGEEEFDFGGVFIMNGGERVLRNTLMPRPNHAITAKRDKNSGRGPLFSDLSLAFRSMRRDISTSTMHFHFMRSTAVRARVSIRMNEYFIPVGVILRALLPSGTTDREIYDLIVGGETDDAALCNSAIAITKELYERYRYLKKKDTERGMKPTLSRMAVTSYLGKNFRVAIGLDDESIPDWEAGTAFLRRYILPHLSVGPYEAQEDNLDRAKADLIVHLIRKLVATSTGDIEVDNPDALSHQGVMTSGHLYLAVLKERCELFLSMVGMYLRRESEKIEKEKKENKTNTVDRSHGKNLVSFIKECILKVVKNDMISKGMRYLISTGNLYSKTRIDLPQRTGYSIVAERINFFRYLSHFRAIHRGTFYAQMRSTKVRKLLPEAWGFICPVHTPDGDPCGILNHLSADCSITHGNVTDSSDLIGLLTGMNMMPAPSLSSVCTSSQKGSLPVLLDGRVVGYVHPDNAQEFVNQLRYSKVRSNVPLFKTRNEIALVMPIKEKGGFMPGVYIYTGGARVMRPVKWLKLRTKIVGKNNSAGMNEWIGSFEQVFMRIRPAVANSNSSLCPVDWKNATHEEISMVNFMSVLAQLSPFPDMNQGPRNMFQCQMAKQTMGTPCHAMWNRQDSKVYHHNTPQVPITRNFCMQDPLGADLYPNGVNAVVAVVSYSGNDMEDALILNKASIDRGFARGTVYVNDRVNLDDSSAGRESILMSVGPEDGLDTVGEDGLPQVGTRVQYGTKLYGKTAKHARGGVMSADWITHKSVENGVVDHVVAYDSDIYNNVKTTRGEGIREANVRIRIPRLPTVGDKFASRAGQKGTMSSAWPSEDMPFTESGMSPDILFNPNGFPSRMTIGMMVEIMSGKSGALHGVFNDSTPFLFDEEVRAVDFFAEQLLKAGYQYSGNETLYSGYTGEPLQVEIFTGIVHYQRLRHMVADKFQVRSTGSVHPLFRQPIKGRKRGGAIRFGEMERDGLLAHGAAFLLQDRLAVASDLHVLHVCESCGSLLSPIREKSGGHEVICMVCEADERKGCVRKVALPYSFKYLVNELAAMNIRTVLKLKEVV